MTLTEIGELVQYVTHIQIHQSSDTGQWEVVVALLGEMSEKRIFMEGKLSHEYQVTNFHTGEPRTWINLEKAVRTMEKTLGIKFTTLDISLQGNSKHEKAKPRGS